MNIYEVILTLSKEYSVYEICKALEISQSSYSYWKKNGINNEKNKIYFYQKVIEIYRIYEGIYGAPKICNELNKVNINCSVSKVSRAMEYLGLKSIVISRFPKKKSQLTTDEKNNIVNLIKDLKITSVNQVWTTDITYIKTHSGMYYLISFIDYYSKMVVAWSLSSKQRTEQILEVLEKAIKNRKPLPGLIIHSDKGSQMRSNLYRQYLKKHNMIFSYTSLNHSCDENAAQESFHSLLKKEKLYQKIPNDFEDAQRMISEYIDDFYNTRRSHSSLGYKSPLEFEKNLKTP